MQPSACYNNLMNQNDSVNSLLLLVVSFFTGLASIFSASTSPSPTSQLPMPVGSPSPQASPVLSPSTPGVKTTLSVTVLKTDYGISGPDGKPPNPTYPSTATISADSHLISQVAGYGVVERILIAPKNWTGNGSISADGNAYATLYPKGVNPKVSSRLIYKDIPGCIGCMYGEAALYFPSAKAAYEKNFPGIALMEPPLGLSVQRLSDTLVRYSLADTPDGLSTNGVAYFSDTAGIQPSFVSLEVRLPHSQGDLSTFLLNDFVARYNLK